MADRPSGGRIKQQRAIAATIVRAHDRPGEPGALHQLSPADEGIGRVGDSHAQTSRTRSLGATLAMAVAFPASLVDWHNNFDAQAHREILSGVRGTGREEAPAHPVPQHLRASLYVPALAAHHCVTAALAVWTGPRAGPAGPRSSAASSKDAI